MTTRPGVPGGAALAAAAVAACIAGAHPVGAAHDSSTPAEFTCQYKASPTAWKFFAKKANCVVGCQRSARAGKGSASDCVPPYAGQAHGCVNAAEGKATAAICKGCSKDLPECFGFPQNCPDLAEGFVLDREADLDALAADVYCDDSGSGDGLTAGEGACQDVLLRSLGAFAAKKAKCLAKCHAYEHKGVIPAGSCTPGAISDPTGKIVACLTKLETKVKARIDAYCTVEAPECHGGMTSQQWIDGVEASVDAEDPTFFCGSPSGAFLD